MSVETHKLAGALVRQTTTPMLAGWPGIEAALFSMQSNVETAMRDPRVRQASIEILHRRGAKGGDRRAEAEALFDFVIEKVEYRRDPAWLEFIQDPRVLLEHIERTAKADGNGGWAAGDCDDHAQLIEVLALQVRLPVVNVLAAESERWMKASAQELIAAMQDAQQNDRPVPVHVYAAMRDGSGREPSRAWLAGENDAPSGLISLDTARPGAAFAEHVPNFIRYVRPVCLDY